MAILVPADHLSSKDIDNADVRNTISSERMFPSPSNGHQNPPPTSQLEENASETSLNPKDAVISSINVENTSPTSSDKRPDSSKESHSSADMQTGPRGIKRKRNVANGTTYADDFDPPYKAATTEEKNSWQGFCEIESEPAIFNYMLRQWGVRGVKIQEMFGVDNDSLLMLSQPVYGVIFLFQYMDEDFGSQVEQCPPHVWFANQVTNNSCASVALLNMVNNIPSVKLGPDLESFRKFTHPFSPSIRGEQVANYEFIKRVHNSFARKIDMLTADMTLGDDFKESMRKRLRKSAKKLKTVDDSAFHFVAYMPICGEIWKLDGLDSTPQEVMKMPADSSIAWLQALAPVLMGRMADCQDGGIQFNLLALVQDPLAEAQSKLLRNLRLMVAMGEETTNLEVCGLSQEQIEEEGLNARDQERLDSCSNTEALSRLKEEVKREQDLLRSAVIVERSAMEAEEEKATDRRNDYGPFLQKWLMLLAEKGVLKDLAEAD